MIKANELRSKITSLIDNEHHLKEKNKQKSIDKLRMSIEKELSKAVEDRRFLILIEMTYDDYDIFKSEFLDDMEEFGYEIKSEPLHFFVKVFITF